MAEPRRYGCRLLPLPQSGHRASVEELVRVPAVALFIEHTTERDKVDLFTGELFTLTMAVRRAPARCFDRVTVGGYGAGRPGMGATSSVNGGTHQARLQTASWRSRSRTA
jgi:hypothetical protein